MKHLTKLAATTATVILASGVAASAAILDFTAGTTGATSGSEFGGWSMQGYYNGEPHSLNTSTKGPGPMGPLAGDNDGAGVRTDEISFETDYVTITFAEEVTLIGAYFLDLYDKTTEREVANISVGDSVGEADASLAGYAIKSGPANPTGEAGYGELLGISLRGTQFTFFAGATNDTFGTPDFALAGLDVAPVPLPAGMLLLPTAIGGLMLARRRKKQA